MKSRFNQILLISLILLFGCIGPKEDSYDFSKPIESTEYFDFYSSPWINLHHFLYNYATWQRDSVEQDSIYYNLLSKLEANELTKFHLAVSYYQEKLIGDDLRTGDKNHPLKLWLIDQQTLQLPTNPELPEFDQVMMDFLPVYQKYVWNYHNERNLWVLKDNIELINRIEKAAVQKLETLTKSKWQERKIRVDISYHSKYERPYTNTRPTVMMVMDSKRNYKPAGNWIELLLHEASHHLIFSDEGFIGETIIEAGKRIDKKLPRSLSHAYLFYFSGIVAKELLEEQGIEEYELYMVRNRVFEWSYPILEKNLRQYLKTQSGLDKASEQVILDAHEFFDQQNN